MNTLTSNRIDYSIFLTGKSLIFFQGRILKRGPSFCWEQKQFAEEFGFLHCPNLFHLIVSSPNQKYVTIWFEFKERSNFTTSLEEVLVQELNLDA